MTASPERILGVSQTQFSIARHYGGCKFNGHHYVYIAESDELVRDDIFKRDKKARTAFAKAEKAKYNRAKRDKAQGGLF